MPKAGRSPYCTYCQRDRLDGVRLTSDQEWVHRRQGRDRRPKRRPSDGPPVEGLHWCSGCRDWLHPRWFLRFKEYAAGRDIPSKCRPCRSQAAHDARVRQRFGIEPTEYRRILDLQDGVCAICGATPRTARLAVDHWHGHCKDGCPECIRGLLCSKCNNELLGSAHDSIEILRRAIEYLEHPPAGIRPVVADAANF
jgi:hypothetical protein